jgi:hypothetical protein
MATDKFRYLNTDLDLMAEEDLRPLARALQRHDMLTLGVETDNHGSWRATLEANRMARTPNGHIAAIINAAEALDGKPRMLRDRCRRRECNIGYECGDKPWAFNQVVQHRLLKRMVKLGLALRITLYPSRPPDSGRRQCSLRNQ